MEAIQNAQPVESFDTRVGECPTCLSGTDPIIFGLGVDILEDPE